jgi:DNA processing protein
VLDASAGQLAAVQGIGPQRAQRIRRDIDELIRSDALAAEHDAIARCDAHIIAIDDTAYPRLLRHISDPPPLLYVRGRLVEQDAVALAVVGARRCTHYGREQAGRLAALAARAGLTIVSGGAYGIDAAAHRATLQGGGRPIAVLGSGLADPYPPEHIDLFDRIVADDRGAVVSELPMTAPPRRENFPSRNRIISGLSLGVLVIEASLRSGALITARLAAEEHHREVLALPGRVDSPASAGCHRMLREGWAALVTGLDDILNSLGETGQLLAADYTITDGMNINHSISKRSDAVDDTLFTNNLSDSQRMILMRLADLPDPRDVDALAVATGLAVPALRADLTLLEIRGLVRRHSGGYAPVTRGHVP